MKYYNQTPILTPKVEVSPNIFTQYITGIHIELLNNPLGEKEFTIPVIDIRNPSVDRKAVEEFRKTGSKGSQFIKPSFSMIYRSYNQSWKKT